MRSVVRILTDAQMEQLRSASVNLLVQAGMKIKNEEILGRLEKEGARIDHPGQRAFLTSEMISRLLPDSPTNMLDWELQVPDADDLRVWGSHPFVLDWPSCTRRESTRSDLMEAIKAVHSMDEVKRVGPPLSISELPAVIEPIEAMAMTMQMTDKKLHHVELQVPEQIKYAVRLSEIHTNDPNSGALVPVAEYFQSPLVFGARSSECVLEKARFGIASRFGTMVTSGLNAPGTVAGTITLGLAEIIGGLIIGKVVDPKLNWGGIACSGMLDMATGKAFFSTPECTLQDMALYQIIRSIFGLEIIVAEQYIDAPTPGIQATFEKTYQFCSTAAFGAHILLNNGLLEAGLTFSGLQCVLDLDTNRALLRLYRGVEVNDDTIAQDLLLSACAQDAPNFLNEDHTALHCRSNFWYPKMPLRARVEEGLSWQEHSARILEQANDCWNNAVQSYCPISISDDKRRAIENVVDDARKEFLS